MSGFPLLCPFSLQISLFIFGFFIFLLIFCFFEFMLAFCFIPSKKWSIRKRSLYISYCAKRSTLTNMSSINAHHIVMVEASYTHPGGSVNRYHATDVLIPSHVDIVLRDFYVWIFTIGGA